MVPGAALATAHTTLLKRAALLICLPRRNVAPTSYVKRNSRDFLSFQAATRLLIGSTNLELLARNSRRAWVMTDRSRGIRTPDPRTKTWCLTAWPYSYKLAPDDQPREL